MARRLRQLYAQGGDGLTFLELAVLQRLERGGPASPGSLAGTEGVTSAAIATVVTSLVTGEFADRTVDPADRRRAIVTINQAGRAALAAREAVSVQRIEAALRGFTARERRQIADAVPLLERMASQL